MQEIWHATTSFSTWRAHWTTLWKEFWILTSLKTPTGCEILTRSFSFSLTFHSFGFFNFCWAIFTMLNKSGHKTALSSFLAGQCYVRDKNAPTEIGRPGSDILNGFGTRTRHGGHRRNRRVCAKRNPGRSITLYNLYWKAGWQKLRRAFYEKFGLEQKFYAHTLFCRDIKFCRDFGTFFGNSLSKKVLF